MISLLKSLKKRLKIDKKNIKTFFGDFSREITKKRFEMIKKGWKKCFDQLMGALSTQKLVEIHNKHCFCGGTIQKSFCLKLQRPFENLSQIRD